MIVIFCEGRAMASDDKSAEDPKFSFGVRELKQAQTAN